MGMLNHRGTLEKRRAVLIGGAAVDLRAMVRRVLGMRADATRSDQLARCYGETARFFDGIDVLVNVIGGTLRKLFG
jgi:3-oxoacyl-[acyl-carrier protein] reductase